MKNCFENRKVLVVGMARSGIAAAHLLRREGAEVTVTDRKPPDRLAREIASLPPGTRTSLGGHQRDDFSRCDLIVLSPGVPSSLPLLAEAVRRGVPLWSEVELAARFVRGRIIGVTGSNGKTTTTTLIGKMLQEAGIRCRVAGNIGTPLSRVVAEEGEEETLYVVELSSFQLENIVNLRCQVAVLLNVTPDHLDRYSDFEAYAAAKGRIFLNQTGDDHSVVNGTDPVAGRLAESAAAQLHRFDIGSIAGRQAYLKQGRLYLHSGEGPAPIAALSDIQVKGSHNLENILAAALASFLGGAPIPAIRKAVESFRGIEHRLEYVRSIEGVEFYNDSKATNVDSARKGLEAFPSGLIAIMGGLDKNSDFSSLRPLLEQRTKRVILIGAAAEKMAAAFGRKVQCSRADSLEEAVREAFESSAPGEAVALIPACASFDMFTDFEDRGRSFKRAVEALANRREEVRSRI